MTCIRVSPLTPLHSALWLPSSWPSTGAPQGLCSDSPGQLPVFSRHLIPLCVNHLDILFSSPFEWGMRITCLVPPSPQNPQLRVPGT